MTRTKSPPKTRQTAAQATTEPSPPVSATPTASPAPIAGPSVRQLAHELNSLLDGSMRCVGLARTSLQKQQTPASGVIDDGLGKAHAAMQHMAALLARAMKQTSTTSPAATVAMFHAEQSMSALLEELQGLLAPHAQQARATMAFEIDANSGATPAGPLGAVLMNGLRNALQACEAADGDTVREASLNVSTKGQSMNIVIVGPASSKPAGHRIGMGLSEQIVAELGGELALTSSSALCTLRICVPLASLNNHA